MTIIVALAHGGGVTVGCDTLWTAGQDMLKRDQPKWTINESGLSVGLSGSPYVAEQIGKLAGGFSDPHEFCDQLRLFFRQDDRWPPELHKESGMPTWDLNLLLTDGRDVWEVGAVLYPLRYERGRPVAVGSGYQYALGAMHATQYALKQHVLSHIPKSDHAVLTVTDGLAAAIEYDTRCGGERWVGLVV